MATLSKDPQSGNYNVRFRYGKRSFRRSLRTANRKEGLAALGRVEETIRLLQRGSLIIPPEADPATFILSGGQLDNRPKVSALQTVSDLFELYQQSLPDGAKEKSTLKTERIHMAHLGRILKRRTRVRSITTKSVQDYIHARLTEADGCSVKPITVKKEVATFRFLWNWAVGQGHLSGRAPTTGFQYPKTDEQHPFMTWEEIETVIARGRLSDEEQQELWGALFLTTAEIEAILLHVKAHALHPQIYPMILFPAHSGARCSEILRSRIDDFDFQARTVQKNEVE